MIFILNIVLQREPGSPSPTIASLSQTPPFCPLNITLSDVQKTGMGSSAALITSIVSALLLKFGLVSKEGFAKLDSRDRVLAHNTAQLVHCLAQGKVGSGFDVSAAVFGSHVYTRFDPNVLTPVMNTTGDFSNVCHDYPLFIRCHMTFHYSWHSYRCNTFLIHLYLLKTNLLGPLEWSHSSYHRLSG